MSLKATKSLPKSAQTKPKGSQCRPQGSPKTPKSHPKGHNREPKLPKDPFQEPKCDPRRQKSAKMASQCPLKGQKIMKDAPFEAPKSQQKSFPFKPANPHPPHPTRTTTHTKRRKHWGAAVWRSHCQLQQKKTDSNPAPTTRNLRNPF